MEIKRAALLSREGSYRVLGKVRTDGAGVLAVRQTDGWGPDGRTQRETRSQRVAENWPDHTCPRHRV